MVSITSPAATLKEASAEQAARPEFEARQLSYDHDQRAATFMVVLLAVWLVIGLLIAGATAYMYR